MSISHAVSRLSTYYRRHGFRASAERAWLFVRQSFSSGKMVVFYWDLTGHSKSSANDSLPDHLTVERKSSREEIDSSDWSQIINFWNPEICEPLFSLRLKQGATIWLLRSEGKLAGYIWTVIERTLDPYYYPLAAGDAHLYDSLVFPEYRGRRFHLYLLNYVMTEMKAQNMSRAHFDVAEGNRASLSSTAKTAYPRHLVGVARKATFFGRTFVEWTPLQQLESERVQVPAKKVTPA